MDPAAVIGIVGGAAAILFGGGGILGWRSAVRQQKAGEVAAARDHALRAADVADEVLRGIIAELRDEVAALRGQVESLRVDNERLSGALRASRSECAALARQLADLRQDLTRRGPAPA